ncbi:MAG: RIO1 family regulatory kinase/ATPase [Dehalococcoidia bacterium]
MSSVSTHEKAAAFTSRNTDLADMAAIQEFIDEALVLEVLNVIKSGKEATVYRCRAHPSLGAKWVAVKVYHSINFQDPAVYDAGRQIANGQVRRAVNAHTEFGREAQAAIWTGYEYETLCALHEAGADVPEPFASTDTAILMEYVGNGAGAAPQLHFAELEVEEAREAWKRILWNIELWLKHNLVHADLSDYNILWWGGRPKVIDLPQAVDPRFNPHARKLLERDVRNVAGYFRRYGAEPDVDGIVRELWEAWTYGDS